MYMTKERNVLIGQSSSSSSSIGCGAGNHKVSTCTTIISKCGNLLFLHCSFIIPKQSLLDFVHLQVRSLGVWSMWLTRSPFANGWNVQSSVGASPDSWVQQWVRVHKARVRVWSYKARVRVHQVWVQVHWIRVQVRVHWTRVRVQWVRVRVRVQQKSERVQQ